MPKRLSRERVDEIKTRYLAGEKYVVIAHEMGISWDTILKYANRLGLPKRQPHQQDLRTTIRRLKNRIAELEGKL